MDMQRYTPQSKRKIGSKERDQIMRLFHRDRCADRCVLVQKLTDFGRELVATYDTAIAQLDGNISELTARKSLLVKERDAILTKNKLITFDRRRSCEPEYLHPDLVAFDKETEAGELHILTM